MTTIHETTKVVNAPAVLDYKAAFDAEYKTDHNGSYYPEKHASTVRRALLISHKLQQEPSSEMEDKGDTLLSQDFHASGIFKAMTRQLLKEVDEELK